MTDPIADLLTRIRNAGERHMETIDVPYSKMKENISNILKEEGFISSVEKWDEENQKGSKFSYLTLGLKYTKDRKLAIESLKRVSKPGIRRYVGYKNIPRVLGGLGICILSTPNGIITGKKAREMKVGGELICTIY